MMQTTADQMIEKIKAAFEGALDELPWMDAPTAGAELTLTQSSPHPHLILTQSS